MIKFPSSKHNQPQRWSYWFAILFFCAFVSVFPFRDAKAQWVVSDPVTETATSATAIATVVNFVQELLQLQTINGALATLHSDIHLLVSANKKIGLGGNQAVVDGVDRIDTQTNLEKVAADGTAAPTSHKFCNVFAAQVGNAAREAASAQGNIMAQVNLQVGIGSTSPGALGIGTKRLNGRCGSGWTFEDTNNKTVCGPKT